uniref:Potassium/proton antiporter CemA n=1 Tax=Phlegmariurus carinatus TaxID=380491 RepID=A0A7G7XPN4_PHLCA|nr:envelope membrane protein [Phlegmariurus carinatus]QNH82374.1 envelope membrane protein [Phlegmariurus carinatus]WBV80280.1 envelope membrane carbon uptake protein [Phlegmariurus squarrosus]
MKFQLYWWKVFRWFSDTPSRSSERAFEASKKIQNIKKDYVSYKCLVPSLPKHSWQAILLYINTRLNNFVFIIYWSVLECKTSIYLLNILNKLELILSVAGKSFYSTKLLINIRSFFNANKRFCIMSQSNPYNIWLYPLNILLSFPVHRKPKNLRSTNKIFEKNGFNRENGKYSREKIDKTFFVSSQSFEEESVRIERMNQKLAWIEATLNDLDNWKRYYSLSSFSLEMVDNIPEERQSSLSESDSIVTTIAYESIGLVPRSITRTLSRFKTELTGQSSSLILYEFRLAKYQAIASLQYIGCLILIPWGISFPSEKWLLKPWIKNWWNINQFQIFLNYFQEERASKRLQEMEELLWLDEVMLSDSSSSEVQSQDLNTQIHDKTIQLVAMYNEDSIQTILHLLTDIIYFAIPSASFISGKKRLAVMNSWIQESFHSLSDTMKAFFILLLTDSCIGFHSPHGWEILISSLSKHLGFAHNKHIISCFVSTFPVISDTVFKYWIFRHLNRISPSIVATYHAMNE